MRNNSDEKRNEIEEKLKKLPKNVQQALYWVIENIDSVIEMCRESDMTCEEIEENKKKALEKEEYTLFFILQIVEMYKNEDFK